MGKIFHSIHHLVPKSRLPKETLKFLNPINTVEKIHYIHKAWHKIFANLTPFEAMIFYLTVIEAGKIKEAEIVVDWEGIFSESFILGETKIKEELKRGREKYFSRFSFIFKGEDDPLGVLKIIIRDWSPANYFYYTRVVDYQGHVFSYCSPELRLAEYSV